MKIFLGMSLFLLVSSSLLGQYSYYKSNPYNNWQYQSSYSGGCYNQGQMNRSPLTKARRQPQVSAQTLEQKYPNLVVMFTSDQCPYCDFMKPIMQKVENHYGDEITFLYINVTQSPEYPAQYGFSTVPQIMYFKNGKKLAVHGSDNYKMTAARVERVLRNIFYK